MVLFGRIILFFEICIEITQQNENYSPKGKKAICIYHNLNFQMMSLKKLEVIPVNVLYINMNTYKHPYNAYFQTKRLRKSES